MIYLYDRPLLPKMHYLHHFTVRQLDSLRYQTMKTIGSRLGRAEPPLRKEVVEYTLDVDTHMWSMRRSKAKFFKIVSLFSRIISLSKWLGDVCRWKNPIHYYSSPCPLLYIDLLPRINLSNCVSLHVSDRHIELLVSSQAPSTHGNPNFLGQKQFTQMS
ncbi:C2 calcium/lipid-binding plant phosphoribosyltransferase family protein [Abeliophyllum distichum]|uniref:C2 calcium/lipid-binding plant phosphoribosyltransferase family protein n=1 Tax=Abeliophyllum distichum TaxID=126358 RepID=A0ABD1VZW8_9LAMI